MRFPRTIDVWSPLSHRAALSEGRQGVSLAPTWVGVHHTRRLGAYKILAAYMRNVQRDYLEFDDPTLFGKMRDYREFGDPKTFRDAIVSALIGSEPPEVVVEGADETPAENLDPAELAKAEADVAAAVERQDWLRKWTTVERGGRKLFAGEQNSVGLGDGVWVFRWSTEKQRVTMRTYEPGFYFPVLHQDDANEYPMKVHIAWEFVDWDVLGRETRYVRRQTWEMIRLPEGETRSYAWNTDENDQATTSNYTVLHSDGTWRLGDTGKYGVDEFTDQTAVWAVNEDGQEIRNLDLNIDFIPIVHVPNTPAEEEHYGQSALSNVAQIQDDISSTDTDIAKAAALTAVPMLGATGINIDTIEVGAGKIINLGENGNLAVVDTSKSLEALLALQKSLLDRRDANGRVPSAILGRVDPHRIQAGIILALSFGPLRALIGEMRLVRDEKYPLMLKIVQRLSIAGGTLKGPVLEATWATSSFLPTDETELVTIIRALMGDGTAPSLISRQTALAWLQDEGFAYDDITEELQRIEAEDFAGAQRLFTATGNQEWTDEYLHRTPDATAPDPRKHEQRTVIDPGSTPPPGGAQPQDGSGTPPKVG